MRILITGSTKLAGAIIDAFNEEILFEKTYVDSCRVHEVPEKLGDYDVFINNAWDNDCQTKLLKFFFSKWKDQAKKIVSIGSTVASYEPTGTGYSDYVDLKRELRKAHCDIVNLKTTKCKSYLVNPGVTDTNLTANQNRKKMTVQDVVDMIKFVLDNKLYIPEIYFYVE